MTSFLRRWARGPQTPPDQVPEEPSALITPAVTEGTGGADEKQPSIMAIARSLTWPQDVPEREFFRAIREQLAGRPRAKVAVLGGASAAPVAEVLRRRYPRLRLVWVDSSLDPSAVHVALAQANPYNLIIDVAE
ncbi:MAG: hypothetical protein ACLGIF_04545, partial [Actinomycetes bacterium]